MQHCVPNQDAPRGDVSFFLHTAWMLVSISSAMFSLDGASFSLYSNGLVYISSVQFDIEQTSSSDMYILVWTRHKTVAFLVCARVV